jgi:hypothetical protein
MLDATHLKTHRAAASFLKKGLFSDVSGAPKRPELQAARGLRQQWTSACQLVSEGQMSDYKGAALKSPTMCPRPDNSWPTRGAVAFWL